MTVGNVEPQRGQTRSQSVIDNVLQNLQAINFIHREKILTVCRQHLGITT
ncbi:hypothetical protein ACP3TB_02630 [Rahnella variigena]|nr:hypothetical protein [Rahnella variigena]MDH2897952.1 hypothetical protein [Rahnella variigena]